MLHRLRPYLLPALFLMLTATSARAEKWEDLSPDRRHVLAPLSANWDTLARSEQKSFIGIADAYPKLPPEKQRRLREQIREWATLTPEQRHRAREKFTAFSKVPEEKREAVKQMVREQQAQPGKP